MTLGIDTVNMLFGFFGSNETRFAALLLLFTFSLSQNEPVMRDSKMQMQVSNGHGNHLLSSTWTKRRSSESERG